MRPRPIFKEFIKYILILCNEYQDGVRWAKENLKIKKWVMHTGKIETEDGNVYIIAYDHRRIMGLLVSDVVIAKGEKPINHELLYQASYRMLRSDNIK